MIHHHVKYLSADNIISPNLEIISLCYYGSISKDCFDKILSYLPLACASLIVSDFSMWFSSSIIERNYNIF